MSSLLQHGRQTLATVDGRACSHLRHPTLGLNPSTVHMGAGDTRATWMRWRQVERISHLSSNTPST